MKFKELEALKIVTKRFTNYVKTAKDTPEYNAYEMGFDCGKHGPNTTNSNFQIFSSPINTRAWEAGKKDGKKAYEDLKAKGKS